MPNPEPDPVPIWNGSFIWNEKFTIEFNYKTIKQMLSFYKEAIKQDMYCYHCLTSNSYKYKFICTILLTWFRIIDI